MPRSDAGRTVGQVYDELVAIRLAPGDDDLSSRSLVGATPAGRQALQGASGERLSALLRTVLGEYTGRASHVQGIVLTDTVDGMAMTMGAAYANILADANIRPLAIGATKTRTQSADAIGVLKIGASKAPGITGGFAPDWVLMAPKTGAALLRLAEVGAAALTPQETAAAARAVAVLKHEIAHTVEPWVDTSKAFRSASVKPYGFPLNKLLTPSRIGWLADHGVLAKLESKAVSPTIWLEEATADVDSMDRREAATVLRAIGLPVNEQTLGQFTVGYPQYAQQLDRLLGLAGIDRTTESGLAAARQVLQGGSLAGAPGRLADAIVTHAGVDRSRTATIATLIEAAGHGASLGSRELPPGFVAKIDEVERLARH